MTYALKPRGHPIKVRLDMLAPFLVIQNERRQAYLTFRIVARFTFSGFITVPSSKEFLFPPYDAIVVTDALLSICSNHVTQLLRRQYDSLVQQESLNVFHETTCLC